MRSKSPTECSVIYAELKENQLYFVGNASKHGNLKMILSAVI
jgi:hypothetical protein